MTRLLTMIFVGVLGGIACDRFPPRTEDCPAYTIESVSDHECDRDEEHCLRHLAQTGMNIYVVTKDKEVLEEALQYSKRGVTEFPGSWQMLYLHLSLLQFAEKSDQARQLFPKLERAASGFEQWAVLSSLYELNGMREKAVSAYEKAAALAATAPIETEMLENLKQGLFPEPTT